MSRACLSVQAGGLFTTVQDLGRFGSQALGVPVSGALDPLALRTANALVSNPQDAGALEIRFLGPTLQVEADQVMLALAGTGGVLEVLSPEPARFPAGQSVILKRGEVLRVGAISDTSSCYLAVAGGVDLTPILGSQSTYMQGGFGGLNGRPLAPGDLLPVAKAPPTNRGNMRLTTGFDYDGTAAIRVVPGPQFNYFDDTGHAAFFSGEYTVTQEANRMGLRLDGPHINHSQGFNIPSDGIVTGSVQVPGTGQPIILLADRQTTGGYPKIGTVISADLPRLGRLKPGDTMRFKQVDAALAETIRREQEARFQAYLNSMTPVSIDSSRLDHALLTENLIDGVISAHSARDDA